MTTLATIGFKADTSGLKQIDKGLDSVVTHGEKAEKALDDVKVSSKEFGGAAKKAADDAKKLANEMGGIEAPARGVGKATKDTDKAMANFSRRSGMAGIQFQQFIGQIQGGQSAMVALSQQSADLGFVLGAPLLGAVAGISASLIGMLLPSLLQTKDAEQLLIDINKELDTSLSKTAEGVDVLSQSILKLAEKSEALAKLQISSSIADAEKLITTSAEGIEQALDDAFGSTTESILRGFSADVRQAASSTTGSMEDIIKSLSEGSVAGIAFGANAAGISDTIRMISKQFGVTRKQAVSLSLSISDVFDDQSVLNIKAFENTLAELNLSTGGSSKEIQKLAKILIPLFDATTDGVDKVNLLREAFGNFGKSVEESDQDLIKFNTSVIGITTSLEAQIIALRDGEEAAINYNIAQRLGIKDGEQIPESIRNQITEIKNLKSAQEEALEFGRIIAAENKEFEAQQKKEASEAERLRKKEEASLKSLTNEVDNFGGAWSRTGNVIVDTFGTMADSLDDYMSRMEGLDKIQTDIDKKREVIGHDAIALDKLQAKVNEEKNMAELSGISSIAGAVGGLFEEKTVAAKAFAAVEKAIAVAQIAMALERMLASTVETGVVVANETVKQGALATTAVVNQGGGDPYSAFVRIAAMSALMATLVGSFSGGGGTSIDPTEQRQKTQGTGSTLGSDDKSQSIIDSQERFEDIQIDQLAELKGIKNSLGAIGAGISLVTRDFIVGGGGDFAGNLTDKQSGSGIIDIADKLGLGSVLGVFGDNFVGKVLGGLFGSTKQKVIDSGIEFVAQSLGGILEGGVVDAKSFFDIETTKKKLFGLSKKTSTSTEFQEIDSSFESQLGAIFSNIGDVVSQSAEILGFDVDKALQEFQVDLGKISLEDLSGEEIEKELQAVFGQQADLITGAAIPSLKEFQQVGEGLFDTLTRVTKEQAVFNDGVERIGFNLSELSSVMQIEVAQSIINLTGGFENFSDLTSSFFDNFFSESEQLAALEESLNDVFSSLGFALTTSREDFKALVGSIDITSSEGQELLATLLEVNPALSDYIDELERVESKRTSMTIKLLELQGKSEEALAMQREVELSALNESLKALQLLIYAEEDRIDLLNAQEQAANNALSSLEQAINLEKQRIQAVLDVAKTAYDAEIERVGALKTALNAENELRKTKLAEAETILTTAFNAEISLIQSTANERISALNSEKSAITATSSAMSSLVNNINKSLGLDGSADLIGALASAQRGDFGAAQGLDFNALTNLDPSGFTSAADLNVQQALNKNRIAQIGGLAGGKLSESEQMLAAIDNQIVVTQKIADDQIENLNGQLETLLGIDVGILSINDAVINFQEAQLALDALNFEAELAKYDMLIESAEDVYNLHEQAYDDQIIKLDDIVSTNRAMLYQTFNINDSIQSIGSAIIGLQTALADSATYQREIAKNTLTSAAAAKEAKLYGQDVRVIT